MTTGVIEWAIYHLVADEYEWLARDNRRAPVFPLEQRTDIPMRDALIVWAGFILLGVALGLLAVAVF